MRRSTPPVRRHKLGFYHEYLYNINIPTYRIIIIIITMRRAGEKSNYSILSNFRRLRFGPMAAAGIRNVLYIYTYTGIYI